MLDFKQKIYMHQKLQWSYRRRIKSFLCEPVIKLLYYACKQLTGHLAGEPWKVMYFYMLPQSTSRKNVTVPCAQCNRASLFSFFISADQQRPLEDTQVPFYIALLNV